MNNLLGLIVSEATEKRIHNSLLKVNDFLERNDDSIYSWPLPFIFYLVLHIFFFKDFLSWKSLIISCFISVSVLNIVKICAFFIALAIKLKFLREKQNKEGGNHG